MCTILYNRFATARSFQFSIFEVDSVEHQPTDPQKNDEIEALQGINVTERYTTYCIYQELSYREYITLEVITIT